MMLQLTNFEVAFLRRLSSLDDAFECHAIAGFGVSDSRH